ncbi:hypothetical protein ETD83_31090 [Actinomadura soli]|uniref:Uncharacterized protein n=1 Tax=Actinomadura soli TaxID=2508997 RepID=A0A5C4J4C6_9ACTN|nr:hypothetical protein [Actinomadura soli]TMQ91398.1 hypothetical protein ETD83_31090 [Actinomadura soli]
MNGRPRTPLTRALTTPLTLWLLRRVYIDTGTDPSGLADRDHYPVPDAVTEHLLGHLVEAVSGVDPRRRSWKPAETQRRLGFLAAHMQALGTRDLAWWDLHRALPSAGTRVASLLPLLLVSVLTGLVPGVLTGVHDRDPRDGLAVGLFFMAGVGFLGVIGLVGGLAARRPLRLARGPAYANLRLRGRVRLLLRTLATGIGTGAAAGAAVGSALFAMVDLAAAVLLAIASAGTGLTVGLRRWAETPMTDDDRPKTPSATLREDLRLNYLTVAGGALLVALLVAVFFSGLLFGTVDREGLEIALILGPAIGVMIGLGLGTGLQSAGATYLTALLLLRARRRLPLRLMRFLREAHQAGLLRQTGPVYQFRHASLQEHLARQ